MYHQCQESETYDYFAVKKTVHLFSCC